MLGQCLHDIVVFHGLTVSLFLAGLVGGFTHCISMCGPFVLSQSSASNQKGISRLRGAALIPYHLGRLTTYVILATLFGSVLNLAFLFQPAKVIIAVPMLLLAGAMFFVQVFPFLQGVFPWASQIAFVLPWRWLSRFFKVLSGRSGNVNGYFIGVLLGFMPCGLVLSALLASASAGDPVSAGFSMLAFGLGTIPALVVTGWGGQLLKNSYPVVAERVTQGLMVCSGLWLFVIAGMLVF